MGLGCFPSLFSASSPRFSQVSIVSTPASFTLICSSRDRRGPRCTRTAQPTGSQRASSSFTLSWSSGLCLRSVPRSVRMALIYGRHLPNLLISSEREPSLSSFVTKLLILEGVSGIACALLCHGSAARARVSVHSIRFARRDRRSQVSALTVATLDSQVSKALLLDFFIKASEADEEEARLREILNHQEEHAVRVHIGIAAAAVPALASASWCDRFLDGKPLLNECGGPRRGEVRWVVLASA